ncbi:MAG: alpha-glucosidase C-terminal domain-containing protein, partial [Lachnospiraceae bacterium]|nr:alpha-glucosidase C-terminal domain-containing protein [Lachnospiraceae bacterium]
DVTRLASIPTNKKHIPLAYGLLLGMPGIPCLYYGSEWGETGEKAPDNDYALRPCFEEPKPDELTDHIRHLIEVRQKSDAICNGSYRNVVIQNHQLVFERCSDKERVMVAINASDAPYTARHQDLRGEAVDLLTDEEVTMDGQLELPPYSVQYLKLV